MRILCIDDDLQIRSWLQRLLVLSGWEVEVAEHGRAGVAAYRAQPADVVLTDIVMPEQEGIETIMQLRKEFPSVRIIAMSGGGSVAPRAYLLSAKTLGAKAILEKPFSRDELLAALAVAMAG
ncbi:MAG: response regulator [Gemmatimonadaceae bacterium]|nr:response regulator [Gemmatimonadaceae bacterium]